MKYKSSNIVLFNVYTFSSTKLKIRAKQYLLGSERMGARERGWREREGVGEGGSNYPIIVCTYE
jgi:hypothetical protein